jgi:hypothetical protein
MSAVEEFHAPTITTAMYAVVANITQPRAAPESKGAHSSLHCVLSSVCQTSDDRYSFLLLVSGFGLGQKLDKTQYAKAQTNSMVFQRRDDRRPLFFPVSCFRIWPRQKTRYQAICQGPGQLYGVSKTRYMSL